jgi:CDP-paratose 2-epimerase
MKHKPKYVLVTGSAGLIGSEAVRFFIDKGFIVHGIDNNMRQYFFGSEASTQWNRKLLERTFRTQYIHHAVDIRNQKAIEKIFSIVPFDLIIHTAAQPSHDWATKEPMTDFSINAMGTLLLLEACRRYANKAVFIFTSTNKVYGNNPNLLSFKEGKTRYDIPKGHSFYKGIDESMSLDQTTHSIFGVSKCAADLMVQEYGRYFHLKTGVFRCGCLTGPFHSGTKLHGFLAYLVKCVYRGEKYVIYGYKGKQVRDNIHAYDLVHAFYHFYLNPKYGEVYNMGGSRHSNISILEAIEMIEKILGKKAYIEYVDTPRVGDHIWYISDVSKFVSHYPSWKYTYSIDGIMKDICSKGHF